MELTDKAVDAFAESGEGFTHPSKWNFEPDDFEGVVVLTVDEAQEILQSSYDLLSWADCSCIHADKALEIQSYLKERIKQVEKDNASN